MVLIAITDRDHTGKWLGQRQLHGRISAISADRGIVVSVEGLAEPFTLPPQIDCLQEAAPGEYREHSSGKVIQDPDYICFWEIMRTESSDGATENWRQGPRMHVPRSVTPWKTPRRWFAIAVCCGIAAGAMVLMAIAGADLAFLACDGRYALLVDLPRCRWPAVWADLGVVLMVLSLLSLGGGAILHARRRKLRDSLEPSL